MRRFQSTRRVLLAAGLTLVAALPANALYMEFVGGAEPVSLQQAGEYGWPKGTLTLVNHKLRKQSWYGVWSGHPNDARHFVYQVESTEQANQLLAVLAEIEAPVKRVLLSPEPSFRSTLSKGVQGNLTFGIGSGPIVKQYFSRHQKGVSLDDLPNLYRPMAPMVTIYVGDDRIQVPQLIIPKGVNVRVLDPLPKTISPKLREELGAVKQDKS
jgi:hypothetical protein